MSSDEYCDLSTDLESELDDLDLEPSSELETPVESESEPEELPDERWITKNNARLSGLYDQVCASIESAWFQTRANPRDGSFEEFCYWACEAFAKRR